MSDTPDQGHRLGFPLTEELAEKTRAVIETVRGDPDDKATAKAVVETVLELTDAGLYEYYVRPLEEAEAGMVALGTAKVGIGTAKKGISVIVNKVIRGMKGKQLQSIADSMEDLLVRADEAE